MAKKPLRSQLNQIRAWVRQGRTDAWIAHQLEVPAAELREFRRRHELSADDEDTGEIDLRDEIEAEIEATMAAADEEDADEDEDDGDSGDDSSDGSARPRRRRRRRRRGGGGGGRGKTLEATFDHGETDGYGLWLDPAIAEETVYAEHWAGHRQLEVTVEADRIVIRRAGAASQNGGAPEGEDSAADEGDSSE